MLGCEFWLQVRPQGYQPARTLACCTPYIGTQFSWPLPQTYLKLMYQTSVLASVITRRYLQTLFDILHMFPTSSHFVRISKYAHVLNKRWITQYNNAFMIYQQIYLSNYVYYCYGAGGRYLPLWRVELSDSHRQPDQSLGLHFPSFTPLPCGSRQFTIIHNQLFFFSLLQP